MEVSLVRRPQRSVVVALAFGLALVGAGCSGEPDARPSRSASASPSASSASSPGVGVGPYRAGDCLAADGRYEVRTVECGRPHLYEVMRSAALPSGATYPPDLTTVEAACERQLPGYLGSPDAYASRLTAREYGPTRAQWDRGERWYACLLGERGPDDSAVDQTASLAGVLEGGLGAYRKCLTAAPLDEPSRTVPCTEPHRSEAVSAIDFGGRPGAVPPQDASVRGAVDRCDQVVRRYLGGTRPGVRTSATAASAEAWQRGLTMVVCYAVSDRTVRGPLGR
ncbi:septum formation family protein [Cryptosporangium minutisporangium]|uniref:Septum formation-related domain-containing protein n=1 Tax=Cryptosporangium minutisporangium TaxID=113569 RepID=A0ABP6T4Y3_9ACTN